MDHVREELVQLLARPERTVRFKLARRRLLSERVAVQCASGMVAACASEQLAGRNS